MDSCEKAKTLKLKAQVDCLMQPLGIRVVSCMAHWRGLQDNMGPFKLVRSGHPYIEVAGLSHTSKLTFFSWSTAAQVASSLGQTKSFFIFNWEHSWKIENPYYGCRSLEEMLVKRDLGIQAI